MQEIEVKFRLDALPSPARIRRWLSLWGGTVGEDRLVRYRDLYWDTPDQALARHRLALRLRLSRKAVWTLKGREHITREMVRRMEMEVPVPYGAALAFLRDPRPERLPVSLQEHLPTLDRLVVIADLVGERRVFDVNRGGDRGELHVEEVWLGSRPGIFLEFEGSSPLVRSFSRTWALYTGQTPEARSKLVWALLHTPAPRS